MGKYDYLKDKVVLVTGGTGSLGEKLVKEILKSGARRVRVFSRDEFKQHCMQQSMPYATKVRYLIGDVRDKERVKEAMIGVDIVFHTSALKHVSVCEYNPDECIKTNITGLQNIIDAALYYSIERVINISTDKACQPLNVYGTSKLMGEKLTTAANFKRGGKKTIFSSIRYGNVLGSRGSVCQVFKRHGVRSISDPRMTRFTITFKEAMNFILTCGEIMQGGEVFIPKLRAYKLTDLASVYGNDNPHISGVGDGEKIHESMLSFEEAGNAIDYDGMYIILPYKKLQEEYGLKYNYEDSEICELEEYISSNVPIIDKEELKEILMKENLL